MKFVDIKNDVAFRKIFGNENRKEVLISFLNAVLQLDNGQQIVAVQIASPIQLPELHTGKTTIVDVKAKDETGKEYIVEMQVGDIDGFDKRVLYYASKSYASQIKRGDFYKKLNPTFFIGILNFKATTNPNYINRHKIIDLETGENYIKDIEFNFIELPKFNKKVSELFTIIDQWIYFIKNAEDLTIIPNNVKDQGLKLAYQDAEMQNWTDKELEEYDKIFMREEDDRNRFEKALRVAVEKGIAEEVEKRIADKIKKEVGKAAIKTEKKAIKKRNIEVVLNFHKIGVSIKNIAIATGLTITEVKNIVSEV